MLEERVSEGPDGAVFHFEAVSREEMVLGLVELAVEVADAREGFYFSFEDEKLGTCAHVVKHGRPLALSKEQLGQLRERSGDKEISTLTLEEAIQILFVPIQLHSLWVGAICLEVKRSQQVVTKKLKELSDEAEQHMGTPRLLGEFRTVAQDLLSSRSRLRLFRRIVEQSREVLGADVVVLYEYLPERRRLQLPPTVSPGRGRKGEPIQYERRIVKKLIDQERPFYAANARSDWFEQGVIPRAWSEATLAFLAREQIESSAGFPLFAGNSRVGALFLNYQCRRTFSPAERIRLETFCSLAASAIRTVQLDEKAKKRTIELDVLDKTTQEIAVRSDLDQRLREIVESAASLLNARGGKIYLKVPTRERLRLSAAVGLGSDIYPIGTEITFAQGMAGEVARTLAPRVVPNYGRYPQRLPDLEDVFDAVIEVPILLGGKLLGVLGVFDDRDRRYFTKRDIPLLSRLAGNAARAIKDARDLELHQELARIDWANLTAETLYSRLVNEAAGALDTSHCTVFLKRYIKGTGHVWRPCATSAKSVVFRQFVLEEGLLGKVYRAGKAMNFPNADQDPGFAEATQYQGPRCRSLAIAPIEVEGKIIGLISADQDLPNWFSDRDVLLLETLALHASIALSGIDRRRSESERKSPPAERIREVRCGEVSYPFREVVEVVETPTSFTLAGLEDAIIGHGQTVEQAQRDFSRQFHETFQRLRSLLPSFRDQQQQALWSILVRLVDIEAVDRNRTVVVPNELGEVLSKQGTARRLKWYSGKVQVLDLDSLPANFATLDEGSWFKAVVEQRYVTGEVTGVLHATEIARPECHDLEARQRFWGQGA